MSKWFICEIQSIYSKANLGRLKLSIIFSGEKWKRNCIKGCTVHQKMCCNSKVSIQQAVKAKERDKLHILYRPGYMFLGPQKAWRATLWKKRWSLRKKETNLPTKSFITLPLLVFQVHPRDGRAEIKVFQVIPVFRTLDCSSKMSPPSPSFWFKFTIYILSPRWCFL